MSWQLLQGQPLLLLVGLLCLLLLVQSVRLWWSRTAGARRIARHKKLGSHAEKEAIRILERAGYRIVGQQVSGSYTLHVDGEPKVIHLRADFLVQKKRQRYVAEVKGGTQAARITGRATRRQLLEYTLAFDVDAILLVDVPMRSVRLVEFPQV